MYVFSIWAFCVKRKRESDRKLIERTAGPVANRKKGPDEGTDSHGEVLPLLKGFFSLSVSSILHGSKMNIVFIEKTDDAYAITNIEIRCFE